MPARPGLDGRAGRPELDGRAVRHNSRYGADGVLHRYLTEHRYVLDDPEAPSHPDQPPRPEHHLRPPFWPASVPGHLQHEYDPCPAAATLPAGELDLVWSAGARHRSARPRRAVVIGSSWAYLMAMYGIDDLRQLMVQRGGQPRRSTLLLPRHGMAGVARARRLAARIPDPERTTVAVSTAEHTVDALVSAYTEVGARVIPLDLSGGPVAPASHGPDRLLIRCLAATTVLATEVSAPLWFAAAVGCAVGVLDDPADPRPPASDPDVTALLTGDEHTRTDTARRVLGTDVVLSPAELRQLLRWRTP